MNKYINADKLIKDLRDNAAEHYNPFVNSIINAQPAADVVEVVRCKDCKYALPEGRENVYICTAKKIPNYCWFDEYCSHGERWESE